MARKPPPPKREDPAVPPRPFLPLDHILGQDRAIAQLRAGVACERLHHAWIFHGPLGVGKFTTALAFGTLLLDPSTAPDLSGTLRSDEGSPTAQLIRAGTHPDLHVITKELAAISRDDKVRAGKQSNIAKAVLEEFFLEPAAKTRVVVADSPAAKVFIIDEAELIDHVGQNTLLKTLEEPPAGTVIILVTSSEDRLFPTIRSRCQRVAFAPLDDKAMQAWLKRTGATLDAERRAWLLGFAAGSPGLAALALENDLFTWHHSLAPLLKQLESGRFPIEMGSLLSQLIDERAAAWVKKNPDASKDAANRAWARRMLAFLAEHYREHLPHAPASARAARAIECISRAEEQLAAHVNLGQVMENLTAQLCIAGGKPT